MTTECTYEGTVLVSCPKDATAVSIREGTTEIAERAFESCKLLTELVLPEGVTKIGAYAFEHCEGLTALTLPATLSEVEWDSFRNMVGTHKKMNYTIDNDPPVLHTDHPRAETLRALLAASNDYTNRYGSGRVPCCLLKVNYYAWEGGASISFYEEDGRWHFLLTCERTYTSHYSDHESGQDLYDTDYTQFVIDIPAEIPREQAVLYAAEHLDEWRKK